ncbi:MAG: DUF2817 domain-containing protein [Deltaproteobacteria bacterium]|nr:DUF2817 domain-containing protein [Deltaproteobacteria bacterium]
MADRSRPDNRMAWGKRNIREIAKVREIIEGNKGYQLREGCTLNNKCLVVARPRTYERKDRVHVPAGAAAGVTNQANRYRCHSIIKDSILILYLRRKIKRYTIPDIQNDFNSFFGGVMIKGITRLIILTFTIVLFSACSESRPKVEVDKANLVYFRESYDECRKAFLAAADELKAKVPNTEIASIKVAEPGEDDLFIDTCYLSVDGALFKLKNEGYKKVYELLNPEGKADAGSLSNRFFPVKAGYNIVKYSMRALRDAVLRGQYEFEKGIYYGGNKSEPQKEIIDTILNGAPRDYRAVLALELHTGYGQRNTMHLFPNPQKDQRIKGAMEEVFKGYKVDWGDQGDFYQTTGDLMGYLEKTIAPKMFFVPMVFEFGTMDSQTTMGSIRSIHAVILENQGIQFGYDSDEARKEIKDRFREAYYPSSPEWRSEVIRQVKEGFPVFVDRFMKLKF